MYIVKEVHIYILLKCERPYHILYVSHIIINMHLVMCVCVCVVVARMLIDMSECFCIYIWLKNVVIKLVRFVRFIRVKKNIQER